MRRLVQSKSVIFTLVALYVCASLAAIPVPRLVAELMADAGLSIADDEGAACSCSAATGCATSGSCCCALPVDEDDAVAVGDDTGFALMSISCMPELKWFLAAVPPVFTAGDGRLLNLAELKGERLVAFELDVASIHNLDVLAPPPRSTC
ncbi:MAG: hypothetical protein COB69_10215 [Phycisphaera sp.]|nr:MAG: hypothetical protein COB69_10215 [Phycisphaera sp.]